MSAPPFCQVCRAPAQLICSRCVAVSYCSVQHQKDDWVVHQLSKCLAYQVSSSKSGHFLVAARDIDEGELILTESPFVVGPRHFIPKACCVGCCRRVDHSKTCRRCKWPICSNSCAGLRGPASHEEECSILKSILKACSYCPDHYLMPLRCVLLQTRNPEKWRWIEEQFTFAESGKEGFEKDRVVSVLESLMTPLQRACPNLVFDCSPATMRRMLNVLDAFTLDGSTVNVAPTSGLYSVASLLLHSCVANTCLFFEDAPESSDSPQRFVAGRVTVKAARDIKQGEPLTRNSGFATFPTVARLGSQKVRRNIRCSCVRCVDPHENGSDLGTLMCPQCSGTVVPSSTDKIEHSYWKCEGPCNMFMSAEVAANFFFSLSTQVSCAVKEAADVSTLEDVLSRLEAYLHPNHALCLSVKCRLLKMYGYDSDLGALDDVDLHRKAALGREVVNILDKLGASQIHQEILNKAQCYMEYAKAEAEVMRRQYSKGAWNYKRVMHVVWNCTSTLRRMLNFVAVDPCDPHTSQYLIAKQVKPKLAALLSWVQQNGMEVPETLISSFLSIKD